jgi:hypothetical protein
VFFTDDEIILKPDTEIGLVLKEILTVNVKGKKTVAAIK